MAIQHKNDENQLFEFIKTSKLTKDQLKMVEVYIQELNSKTRKK